MPKSEVLTDAQCASMSAGERPPDPEIVIGLDPSIVSTGYAVLRRGDLIDAGDIRVGNDGTLAQRLERLYTEVYCKINESLGAIVVVEFPAARKGGLYTYGSQSAILAATYGAAAATVYWAARGLTVDRRVLTAAADAWPGELVPRPPGTKGDKNKERRVEWVQLEYGITIPTSKARVANVADAILLARWGEDRRNGQ